MRLERVIQLKPEEEILLSVREVALPRIPAFFMLGVWFLLPFFLLFPLFRLGFLGVLGFFAILLPACVFLWREWRRWSDTVLVITDRRVIDVERRGLFDTEVCEASFMDVDEVTFRIKGFLPTLCRYGDVEVKIAGAAADIEFKRCKHPSRVHDLIADLRRAAREGEEDPLTRRVRRIAKAMPEEDLDEVERAIGQKSREAAAREFLSSDQD